MPSNEEQSLASFEIPSNWAYRGEGNCNIVLSLPKLGKILRIRKIDRPVSLIGWVMKWINDFLYWYTGGDVMEELRDLKFYSTVMRPLVGIKYTSEACQVILTRIQVQMLEEELVKYRPEFRKHKILQYGRASLFNDFAFIPEDECEYLPFRVGEDTFAIEIKPKQGWRPLSEKHYPACVFCMHQYLKLQQKKIKVLGKYCPEDLFSGNETRMIRAIHSLIQVPQNNFKVFKNGTLVYGENTTTEFSNVVRSLFENRQDNLERLIEEFCNLVRRCLLTNFMNVNFTEHCEEKRFCEWNKIIQGSNAHVLEKNCVLDKILSIQMLDNEGSDFYGKLLSNRENLEDWKYVNMLLAKTDNEKPCVCLQCKIMMLGSVKKYEEEIDLTFIPYLISAVAKDCSLMITVKKITENIRYIYVNVQDIIPYSRFTQDYSSCYLLLFFIHFTPSDNAVSPGNSQYKFYVAKLLKNANESSPTNDDLEIKNIIKTNYGHFVVNIGVFDLYPKRLSSIRKHCQRNKDVCKAYIAATSKKKVAGSTK